MGKVSWIIQESHKCNPKGPYKREERRSKKEGRDVTVEAPPAKECRWPQKPEKKTDSPSEPLEEAALLVGFWPPEL